MRLSKIIQLLECEVLIIKDEDPEIESVGAADLMSDVLAFGGPGMILVTGLNSPQCVRTASVVGAAAVVIIRKRNVPETTIELAQELVHLLFPVAGGFGDDEIRGREIRAGVRPGVAVAGLDQGTDVLGQHRLRRGRCARRDGSVGAPCGRRWQPPIPRPAPEPGPPDPAPRAPAGPRPAPGGLPPGAPAAPAAVSRGPRGAPPHP